MANVTQSNITDNKQADKHDPDPFFVASVASRWKKRRKKDKHLVHKDLAHKKIRCDLCKQSSFEGKLYHCIYCEGFDLCGHCKETGEKQEHHEHQEHHEMIHLENTDNDLHTALKHERFEEASELIQENGADCGWNDLDYYFKATPLSMAISEKELKCSKLLLNMNDESGNFLIESTHLDQKDIYKMSALMYAVDCGMPDLIPILLQRGAKIENLPDDDGKSRNLLMQALSMKNLEVAMQLLSYKITAKEYVLSRDYLNEQDKEGNRALDYAIQAEALDIVRILLDRGVKVAYQNLSGRSPIMRACRLKNESIVSSLLNWKENPVKRLLDLEHLNQKDNDGFRALDYSLSVLPTHDSPSDQISISLIERGVEIAYQSQNTAFSFGFGIPQEGLTPLIRACKTHRGAVAIKLLNVKDEKDDWKLCLDHLNLKYKDFDGNDGENALMSSLASLTEMKTPEEREKMLQVLDILIERKVSILEPGAQGFPPLIYTSLWNMHDTAKKLLDAKDEEGEYQITVKHIDEAKESMSGETALSWAICQNSSEIIQLLLERGASLYKGGDETQGIMPIKKEDYEKFLDSRVQVVCFTQGDLKSWKPGKFHDSLVLDVYFIFKPGTLLIRKIVNLTTDHKNLVKHPGIQAFLMMKWKKIKKIWRTWMLLKTIFFALLCFLAFFVYDEIAYLKKLKACNNFHETNGTLNTSENSSISKCTHEALNRIAYHKEDHTSVSIKLANGFFLLIWIWFTAVELTEMKGNNRKWTDLSNFLHRFWLAVSLILLAMVFIFYDCSDTIFILTMNSVFLIVWTFFLLVEIFQFLVSPEDWAKDPKNFLQVIILIISGFLIFSIFLEHENPDKMDICKHCFGILFPMMYFEFLFELGIHPDLTKYISMFTGVFNSFFGYFMVYGAFLITFAIGFGIMLPLSLENTKDAEDWPTSNWFILPKTIVMFTGEHEFMGIPFSNDNIPLMLIEITFFLVFLILMVIILLNLLNALAVQDAGEMLKTAEMDKLSSLLDTVVFFERIFQRKTFFDSTKKNKSGKDSEDSMRSTIFGQSFDVINEHQKLFFQVFENNAAIKLGPATSLNGRDTFTNCVSRIPFPFNKIQNEFCAYSKNPWSFTKKTLSFDEKLELEFTINDDIANDCKEIIFKRENEKKREEDEKRKEERVTDKANENKQEIINSKLKTIEAIKAIETLKKKISRMENQLKLTNRLSSFDRASVN